MANQEYVKRLEQGAVRQRGFDAVPRRLAADELRPCSTVLWPGAGKVHNRSARVAKTQSSKARAMGRD